MIARLAFLHDADDRFFALLESISDDPALRVTPLTVTSYDHENTFLKLAATAGLPHEVTVDMITTVLLSVSQPTSPHRWLTVDLSASQRRALGLHAESVQAAGVELKRRTAGPEFARSVEQFYAFLTNSPTPFVMLEGAEHRMAFINPAYIQLIGRVGEKSVIGKPVREALPELEGQPFFGFLDKVYRTGVGHVGTETPATLRSEVTGEYRDCFFDFIYHPVLTAEGNVCGIMVQTTEVTERVLARQVLESRERRLYNQWAELEAIYKTAPSGVALLDANTLDILRINEVLAGFFGGRAAGLEGVNVRDLAPTIPAFNRLLEETLLGKAVQNTLMEQPVDASGVSRTWVVSIAPLLSPSGVVEKLCVTTVEVPGKSLPGPYDR